MSEYQYYEWQTIDRPLTAAEEAAVNKLSSHIDVSTTQAVVSYTWGDFKHDPKQVLARYFDAFLYFANWGCQRLAFRFPKGLIDERAMHPYLWEDCSELETAGDFLLLDIYYPDQDGGNEFEGEAHLSALAPLRENILAGDYRALYLAWLVAAAANDIDEEQEPPVPPGLMELSAPLAQFANFFGIEPFLIQAAAQASGPLRPTSPPALDQAIARLSRAESDAFLRRLAEGEPLLALKLNRRLREVAGLADDPQNAMPRRTWGEIRDTAKTLRQDSALRQREARAAQRLKDLQDFAPHTAQVWRDVQALLEQKHAHAYDEAVTLLIKLRDLAVFQKRLPEFQTELAALSAQYAKRPAFQERLRKAGLV